MARVHSAPCRAGLPHAKPLLHWSPPSHDSSLSSWSLVTWPSLPSSALPSTGCALLLVPRHLGQHHLSCSSEKAFQEMLLCSALQGSPLRMGPCGAPSEGAAPTVLPLRVQLHGAHSKGGAHMVFTLTAENYRVHSEGKVPRSSLSGGGVSPGCSP
jgi:hypothetical protein